MKNTLRVLALVIFLIACSDFFPQKTIERDGPGPAQTRPLPEKAVQDAKACDYGDAASPDVRAQFVWSMASKSICPRVREFRYHVTMLRLASEQLCVDADSPRVEKDLRNLWYPAIATFEYLVANPMEPMRAVSNKLSMEMYAWPNDNKAALNGELVKASNQDEAYVMRLAPSRKGFTAVERLIFDPEALLLPGPTGVLRPEEAAFNALTRAKRRRARCVVLRQLTNDIAQNTESLYDQWSATGKAYPREVLRRIETSEQSMILNEISDGLFYLEKVRDYKIGSPLGLNAHCRLERCPDDVEHRLSGAGLESLRANFDAFKVGMVGEFGPGFLALLEQVGRGDLAASMRARIEALELTLQEVEKGGDFRDQVLAMDKAVCVDATSAFAPCRLYFQWREFSAIYRTDFATALNLNPPRTEADND